MTRNGFVTFDRDQGLGQRQCESNKASLHSRPTRYELGMYPLEILQLPFGGVTHHLSRCRTIELIYPSIVKSAGMRTAPFPNAAKCGLLLTAVDQAVINMY